MSCSAVLRFKGVHTGERVVVAGNGPSLNKVDLKKINCPTFGVNGIFHHPWWKPVYYCAESKKFCRANAGKVLRYKGPVKFIADRCRQFLTSKKPEKWHVRALKRVAWVKVAPKTTDRPQFSTVCHKAVCHGMNVIYMCLQLAFYMGASQVVLIGLDFDYADGQIPADHFYNNTLQEGNPMDTTHKDITLKYYRYAHQLLNSAKPRIINASPGTKLDVFPKVKFEDLF